MQTFVPQNSLTNALLSFSHLVKEYSEGVLFLEVPIIQIRIKKFVYFVPIEITYPFPLLFRRINQQPRSYKFTSYRTIHSSNLVKLKTCVFQ